MSGEPGKGHHNLLIATASTVRKYCTYYDELDSVAKRRYDEKLPGSVDDPTSISIFSLPSSLNVSLGLPAGNGRSGDFFFFLILLLLLLKRFFSNDFSRNWQK